MKAQREGERTFAGRGGAARGHGEFSAAPESQRKPSGHKSACQRCHPCSCKNAVGGHTPRRRGLLAKKVARGCFSVGRERKPQAQPERSSGKDRGVPVLPTATGTSFLPPHRRGILSRLWAYFSIYKNKNQGVCPFLSGIFRLPVKGRKTHGRGRLSIPQGKCTGQRLCRVSHTRLPTRGAAKAERPFSAGRRRVPQKRGKGQKTNRVPKNGGNKQKSDKKRHSASRHRKQPIKHK